MGVHFDRIEECTPSSMCLPFSVRVPDRLVVAADVQPAAAESPLRQARASSRLPKVPVCLPAHVVESGLCMH